MKRLVLLVFVVAAACSSHTPAATPTPIPTPAATVAPAVAGLASQLRPGTTTVREIHADMNGDGTDEYAVWSQATSAPPGSVLRQSYVDVFDRAGTSWKTVFTATEALPVDPKEVDQMPQFFQFVPLDGKPDLVLGVLNEGASAGPLDVWVFAGVPPRTAFKYSTTVDGQLIATGNTLQLTTGSYKASDPMCCPSAMDHITIGVRDGKIAITGKTSSKS